MIRSQLQTKRFALVAGLASFAALAGNANAQMHDLLSHSGRGAGVVPPNRVGADQAPRDYTTIITAGQCSASCFEEIKQLPNAINGYFSDVGCDFCGGGSQSMADDVNIGNTTNICDIQYWGGYYSSNSAPTDNFTIVIHTDGGGIPGATIYSQSNVATTRVQTGNVLFGVNEWLYTSTLASTVSLTGGQTYWVEIFNNTGLGTDDWFWETGNRDVAYGNSGSAFDFSTPGVAWNFLSGSDQAYVLCGDVAQPPPPPPQNDCASGCQEVDDQPANGINGYFSEVSCNLCGGGAQVMMDDFNLATGTTLCDITVNGGYFPSNIPPATDTFTVLLYPDAGGCANTGASPIAVPVTATRVLTGNVLFGVDEYIHTLTPSSAVNVPAGTWWLVIYNDTTSTTDDWFWETGDFDINGQGGAVYAGCGFDFSAPPVVCNPFGGVDLSQRVCIPGGGIGTKYCTATNNSTGAAADISASGSNSSAAGTLQLDASPVPNQNGIFFHGANQAQVAFGNGFLCATGGIVRGSVIAGSGNLATYTYDNSNVKHSVSGFVGQNRNFQYWFRDPMGGGSLFNTSNAISINILP